MHTSPGTRLVSFSLRSDFILFSTGFNRNLYYAYALGAAVVARLGLHLRALDGPQRSYRQRLLLRGFGWGLPLAALVSGRPALEGDFQEPALTLLFLGLWSLLSLLSGALSLRKEKKAAQGSKAAQAAKDWP